MIKRTSLDGNIAAKLDFDEDGNLLIKQGAWVKPELIDFCRDQYAASKTDVAGDTLGSFAQIPEVLFYRWIAQGFDPADVSPQEVCARLRAEGYGHFITNAKAEIAQGSR